MQPRAIHHRWGPLDRAAVAAVVGTGGGFAVEPLARHFTLVGVAVLCIITVALARRRWIASLAAAGTLCGASARVEDALHLQDACIDGARAVLVGTVADLPRARGGLVHFVLALDAGPPLAACSALRPRRVRLAWFTNEAVRPHERWAVEAHLRSLRNFRDPGAFDYMRWAQAQSIDAAGSVVRARRIEATSATGFDFDRARVAIGDRFFAHGADAHGVLAALVVGDARRVTPETWELFRSTGTIHLLVVSGLQVTIFATAGVLLGRAIARLLPFALRRFGDASLGAVAGIGAAFAYGALAGWTLPVVRACYMTAVGLAWWRSGRRIPPFRAYAVALAALLAVDPRAIADSSVWLSFGAVGVLIAYFADRRGLPFSSAWLRAQLALFVAMAPLFAATVGQFAWLAPVVNLVAVPFVSLVLTPLALLAAAAGHLELAFEAALLHVCAALCDALLLGLGTFAHAPTAFVAAPNPLLIVCAGGAALLLLAPLAHWQRLALLPLAFAGFHRSEAPVAFGAARVAVLDVGQGLSVLVDTATHRLLYDAGARYPSGFDLGDAVVVPAVRATGDAELDLLVVSHGDLDHRGGVEAVERRVSTRAVLTGSGKVAGIACRRGVAWQWDGVTFEVLHPGPGAVQGNDASCVVSIRTARGRALLTGDVGARAEGELVAGGAPLAAELLVVPHHGSKTSSTSLFLEAVRPSIAIASTGYRNRFGHPHPDVVARYRQESIDFMTTSERGALVWSSLDPSSVSSVPMPPRSLAAPSPDDG